MTYKLKLTLCVPESNDIFTLKINKVLILIVQMVAKNIYFMPPTKEALYPIYMKGFIV